MRFASNLRAFNSNDDQTAVTNSATKILKKSLASGMTWGSKQYSLRLRANLSTHETPSAISDGIGIHLWDLNFYSGGMITALGYQGPGGVQNNGDVMNINNGFRPAGDHRC